MKTLAKKRLRWRLSSIATGTIVTLISLTASITVPAAADTPSTKNDTLSESIRIRAEHGLPVTDQALAERGLSSRSTEAELEGAINQWGFIGTVAEDREIARRDALVRQVEKEVPNLSSIPGYAGHFLDNLNGGTFIVQFQRGKFPDNLSQTLTHAAQRSGSRPSDIQVREVERSSAQLTDEMRTIWRQAEAKGLMSEITNVGEDPRTNGLAVTVAKVEAIEKLQPLTGKGIPVAISVADGTDLACSSRNSCDSPRRGGVGITRSGSACTVGWVMYRGGAPGAVTAGHCWFGTNSGAVLSGSSTYGSLTSTNALTNGTHADMRWISIPNGAMPWIYASDSAKQNVVKNQSLGSVGASACLLGRNNPSPRCGTITSTNSSHVSSTTGYVVYGQSRASFAAAGGDSGGAVASSSTGITARGIVSNGGGGGVNYSWIGHSSTYNMGALYIG